MKRRESFPNNYLTFPGFHPWWKYDEILPSWKWNSYHSAHWISCWFTQIGYCRRQEHPFNQIVRHGWQSHSWFDIKQSHFARCRALQKTWRFYWSWSSSWRHINVTSKVDSQLFWLFRLNPRLVKYETSATWPFVKVFCLWPQTLNLPFFLPCRQSCSRVDPFQQIGRCRLLRPAETDVGLAAGLDRFLHWIWNPPFGCLGENPHPETSQGKFHSSPHEKLRKTPGPFLKGKEFVEPKPSSFRGLS